MPHMKTNAAPGPWTRLMINTNWGQWKILNASPEPILPFCNALQGPPHRCLIMPCHRWKQIRAWSTNGRASARFRPLPNCRRCRCEQVRCKTAQWPVWMHRIFPCPLSNQRKSQLSESSCNSLESIWQRWPPECKVKSNTTNSRFMTKSSPIQLLIHRTNWRVASEDTNCQFLLWPCRVLGAISATKAVLRECSILIAPNKVWHWIEIHPRMHLRSFWIRT